MFDILQAISYNSAMQLTLIIIELVSITFLGVVLFWVMYRLTQMNADSRIEEFRIKRLESILEKIEERENDLYSEISTLGVHSRVNSSPNTIIKFDVVDELYKNVFSTGRLSIEDLNQMRFALDLNGDIDTRTKSTFIRTILQTQWKKNNLGAVIDWIKINRPDIKEINFL
jgi:hypothetical protein